MGDAGHGLAQEIVVGAAGAARCKAHRPGGTEHVEQRRAPQVGAAKPAGVHEGGVAAVIAENREQSRRSAVELVILADQREAGAVHDHTLPFASEWHSFAAVQVSRRERRRRLQAVRTQSLWVVFLKSIGAMPWLR